MIKLRSVVVLLFTLLYNGGLSQEVLSAIILNAASALG
jgi:hypothetical protein